MKKLMLAGIMSLALLSANAQTDKTTYADRLNNFLSTVMIDA